MHHRVLVEQLLKRGNVEAANIFMYSNAGPGLPNIGCPHQAQLCTLVSPACAMKGKVTSQHRWPAMHYILYCGNGLFSYQPCSKAGTETRISRQKWATCSEDSACRAESNASAICRDLR